MISTVRLWAMAPRIPPSRMMAIPVRKTRRGRNSSASLPAVGWATALAK